MRLQYKLLAAFGAIAILISLAGILGSRQIMSVASAYHELQGAQSPSVISLAEIETALPTMQLEPAQYVIKPDEKHLEELGQAEEDVDEALMTYGNIVGQEKVMIIKPDLDELFRLSREIITLRDNAASQDFINERLSYLDNKINAFSEKLDTQKDRIEEEIIISDNKLNEDIAFTLQLTVILAISAVALAFAVYMFASASISKPISRLKQAADQIGNGNFDVDTKITQSSDEIGELCIHFSKMKEGLKNKEKMQNDFISIASHELRTPVQPILGAAELASKGKLRADEAFKVILKEGKRLQRLTNDILEVSRIESGRIKYDMANVNLNEFVSEIAKAFTNSLDNEDVALVTELNTLGSLTVNVDNNRMTQVLNNVIGNALKFTSRGEVKVQTDYFEDRKTVEITITDTGSGIPSELLPNLFGKFVSNNAKTENKQGTGLGLFISRAIVNAHDGTITARNNDGGQGAKFTIALPVHDTDQNRATLTGSDRFLFSQT